MDQDCCEVLASVRRLFCYFDSPQDSLNEILQQLNLGMAILLEGVDS